MNKLTKLLSVFVIAGAIGAGVAGVAGCKKSNGHSHKYSYTVDVEDATKHNGVCDCGKNPVLKQDHVDTKDGDGICDLCGAPVNPQQGGDEVTVTSVTVSAAGGATSVAVEGKLQLSAAVAGTGNPAQTVTWKSSDETKATVNASTGEVTGVAEGSVTITATSTVDTSKSGTINLTVTAKGAVDPGPGPGPVEKSKYETLVEQSDKLYNNDFSEAFTAPTFSGTYGSRGVYSTLEGAVSVVNGALTQANGKGVNFNTIIDFGPLATESALEGYMEVKATDTGTAWNLVQFKNDKGSTVFVIGAGTDKT
ncbi:MAG: Ig-like domain-containing protein, partial [Clostridia bacterium]|nr:Ig-like domain-containing protein [Clostridia bacterium]